MPGRTLGGGTKEGFTGKERDAESGLDYFGARMYMPALSRWMGVDPLAEKHPEWSPYNYVLDNPLARLDPDGRQAEANRGPLSPGGAFIRGPGRPGKFMGAAARGGAYVADKAAAFTPGVSTAQDATAVVVGRDFTGDRLGLRDRGWALVGLLTPLSGKQLQMADDVIDATGDVIRSGGRLGDDAAQAGKPDFVVSADGTAIPVSQSQMREGFDAAGFPRRSATKTSEAGVIHEVPTRHGTTDVRTMEGGAHHPPRAVTTRAGTNDPVKLTGERFKANTPKKERREGSHLEQKP
jgi:RHS repeat-associated protein